MREFLFDLSRRLPLRTLSVALLLLAATLAFAFPTSLVWIPSTDLLAPKTFNLYEGTYVGTGARNEQINPDAPFIDYGLSYGVCNRLEVGVDIYNGTPDPLYVNAKVLVMPKTKSWPIPIVVGIYNTNFDANFSQQDIYALGSYSFPWFRFTFGGYSGRKSGLSNGGAIADPTTGGAMFGLDRTFGKWWLGADYASGVNAVGALNGGIGYSFTDKISAILGYDHYTSTALVDTVNLQLNLNFP